jgi:hypothetical protein
MEPAIFRSTITIDWVADYLNNSLVDSLAYHKLLCMSHSNQPTFSKKYRALLYKLPTIKYSWNWQDEGTQQRLLTTLADEIKLL